MRYFLVDYENVQGKNGLEGINKLKANDKVVIFYSKNANKISIPELQLITQSKANIEYLEIINLGHNALDFNLVYFIGIKAGKFRGKKLEINIISNDNGFDTLKNNPIIQDLNVKIKRIPSIKDAFHYDNQLLNIELLLSKYSLEQYSEKLFNLIKITTSKATLHTALTKELGSDTGRQVYTAVKADYEKFKTT